MKPKSENLNQLDVPVAFFIFRRPETSSAVFEEIKKARPKFLYVISDGPREGNEEEKELVSKTRMIVDQVDWPCQVTKIYSATNMGLRNRILTGLDEVFNRETQAIILEDDCLPSTSFFTFCSQMLDKYIDNTQIALVAGSNFAPASRLKEDYFFSRSTYIWGWASWQRAWLEFRNSPQVEHWSESETRDIAPSFASKIQKKEFLNLMRKAHSLNTWDISLAVWVRQSNKLTIVPKKNLIENIGFGEGATHTKFEAFDAQVETGNLSGELVHPTAIRPHENLERNMWRKKRTRWISFPLKHPIKFLQIVANYFKIR
jgi:hypothetical protein